MQKDYQIKQQPALSFSTNQIKRTGRKYFEIFNSQEFSYTIFRFKTLKNSQNLQKQPKRSNLQQDQLWIINYIQPIQIDKYGSTFKGYMDKLTEVKKMDKNPIQKANDLQKDIQKLCYQLTPNTCSDQKNKNSEWLNYNGRFMDFEQAWDEVYQIGQLQNQFEIFDMD